MVPPGGDWRTLRGRWNDGVAIKPDWRATESVRNVLGEERLLDRKKVARNSQGVRDKLARNSHRDRKTIARRSTKVRTKLGDISWLLAASWGPLGSSWGPLGGLLGASWGPLGGLLGPLDASMVPRGAQEAPREAQEAPKRHPRGAKRRPRSLQEASWGPGWVPFSLEKSLSHRVRLLISFSHDFLKVFK